MVNRRQLLKLSALGTASFAAPLAYSASKITMAYNTGNPPGSSSPKDLIDNAEDLDYLMTGDGVSHPNRLGVSLKSWKGMEAEHNAAQLRRESEFDSAQTERTVEFRDFLESSGFETPVDYVAGLVITRPTQTVRFGGELYRAKDASLPFTTTAWVADAGKFFAIGDAALRQELASPTGAGKSGYRTITVEQRLDQVLSLKAMGCNGLGTVDDTFLLVNAFSRTHIQIDTGGQSDVYLLRHDTLLALTGENRLQIRDGVSIIGKGTINILSNQLADGTRIEVTGTGVRVGGITISEINPVLGRYNFYGAFSALGATNLEVIGLRVIGSNGAAVHIRNNCVNFFFAHLYIRNAKADGFHVQRGSRDFTLLSADIREVEDDCVGIVGHGKNEGFAAPRNGVILGGIFGYQQNGAVGSGIAFIGCHNMQAIQPIIRNTGLSAIRIAEETSQGLYTPRNITVSGADIDNTGLTTSLLPGLSREGVFVSAGYNVRILMTRISRAGSHGVSISGPNVDVCIEVLTSIYAAARGLWVAGGTASGDFVTEIWGDDKRGLGAVSVKCEYLKVRDVGLDRSGTDGAYIDGTTGSLVEPDISRIKSRRANLGSTTGKYGVFFKDATGVIFVDIDGGASGSATALQAPIQFSGSVTGRIDKLHNRFSSLTIPMATDYGIRKFWNASPPTAATGVDGGYKLTEEIRNPNPSTGTVFWICTVAGDPGIWAAK